MIHPVPVDVTDIVQTTDPHVLETARRLAAMDTDSLLEIGGTVQDFIDKETAEFEKRVENDKLVLTIVRRVALKRIVESGGNALPHDRYDCHIERTKTIEKDIATLRQLEGKIPETELAPALYIEQPEPQWKADGTKLNALLRKYGEQSEIGQIIKAGMRAAYGAPKLIFKRRQDMIRSV